MTRYQWLVFILCTLSWALGCLNQQLFVMQRTSAAAETLGVSSHDAVRGGMAAAGVMLLGWAVGGLFFGVLGDKYGRSRMMVWTILFYSAFTGLSGLAVSFGDFLLFRFLAGLGIGGQFAVGAALIAETMPDRVRPYALGLMQWFAVVGSMAGSLISLGVDAVDFPKDVFYSPWRVVFLMGMCPAALAWFVRQYLDEPEKWKVAVRDQDNGSKNAGNYRELFGMVYCRRTIYATILASTGVIGLWGVMFFSVDLCQSVGRRLAVERLKLEGATTADIVMIGMLVAYPALVDDTAGLDSKKLLGDERNNGDVRYLFEAVHNLRKRQRPITKDSVSDAAVHCWNIAEGKGHQTSALSVGEVERQKAFFLGRLRRLTNMSEESDRAHSSGISGAELWKQRRQELAEILQRIDERTKLIDKEAASWGTTTWFLMNIGALFGMLSFTMLTVRFGRRMTFTIFMPASMLSVIGVFMFTDSGREIYLLVPIMGFFLSALFSGYAIYLPELFPTRIRCTAISFCYNTGRFLVIGGPPVLALLTKGVFNEFDEPIRWSGAAMSGVLLIGIAVVWLLPETKGKPLPES